MSWLGWRGADALDLARRAEAHEAGEDAEGEKAVARGRQCRTGAHRRRGPCYTDRQRRRQEAEAQMSDNVVSLPGVSNPINIGEPVQKVVEILEEALSLARQGKIVGVAVVRVERDPLANEFRYF